MATFAVFVVAVTFFLLSSPTAAQISSGYATSSNTDGGVCSGVSSSLPAVAMNAAQFSNGAACGQCVQVTSTGSSVGGDPNPSDSYTAVINNVCPSCNYGDIDVQGSGGGKSTIQWSFVSCGGGRKLIEEPFQGDHTVYTVGEHSEKTLGNGDDVTAESGVEEVVTAESGAEEDATAPAVAEEDATAPAVAEEDATAPAVAEEPAAVNTEIAQDTTTKHAEGTDDPSTDREETQPEASVQKVSRRMMA